MRGLSRSLSWKAGHFAAVLALHILTGSLAFGGSHSVESGAVAVDTRDATDAPTIQSVNGKYFSPSRQAFFLSGFAVQEQINALVDWKGRPTGTIEFRRGLVRLQASSSATLDYNVGNMLMGETLTVQAISADGQKRSVVVPANIMIVPTPPFFQNLAVVGTLFDVVDRGDVVQYSVNISNKKSFWAEDLASIPEDDEGNDIPGISGNPLKWDVTLKVSGSVESDGKYSVTLSYANTGWNIVGQHLTPTLSGGIHGCYSGAAWSLGGHGEISLAGDHEFPEIYLWHLPPVYAQAYLAYSIGVAGEFAWHSTDGLQWEITVPGEFVIGLIAGVGIDDVLAVEVFGGGGPYWELHLFPIPASLPEYGVKFEYGIRLIYLFGEKAFSGEHYMDLTEVVGAKATAFLMKEEVLRAVHRPAESGFRVQSRDYLGRKTLSQRLAIPQTGMASVTGSVDVLQTDGYPYSQPVLILADGLPTVFWLQDDPTRAADENRTELVWQQKTGSVWTAAQPVWDDGTADFSPVASVSTGSIFLAWQNSAAAILEGASLEQGFATQEIAVAVGSPVIWSCTNLTRNGWLDHSPKISAANNGTTLLTWISNPSNSASGSAAEPNAIMFSAWNGAAWSPPAPLATNVGMLLRSSLAWNGSTGVYVCCRDLDDDQGTATNQELYAATYIAGAWSALARLTDDQARDANPQISFGNGGFLLTWFRDGVLMTDTDLLISNAVPAGAVGSGSAAADYRTLRGPGGEISVVWEGLDDTQQYNPLVLNYDLTLRQWSEPVALLDNTNRWERSFSGAFDTNGTLYLAFNSVAIGVGSNGLPAMGAVDLCVLGHLFGTDLAIASDGFVVTNGNPRPGMTVDVVVAVANIGELAVTNVQMALYDGDPGVGGALIGATNTVATVLLAGAQTNWSGSCVLPATDVGRVLYAIVDPRMQTTDRNRANNTRTRNVLGRDLLAGTTVVEFGPGSNRTITAEIVNNGGLPITNAVVVNFRRGALGGPLLGSAIVYPVEPGDPYGASLAWDLSGIAFTSAFETVWVIADASDSVSEISEENNATLTTVMTILDTDGDSLLDGEELQLGTSVSIADTDGDGLNDAAEVRTHGTDPLRVDTDGDGSFDGHEMAAGTDPLSATDVFKIVTAEGTTNYIMSVTWNVKSSATYRVDVASDLLGVWTNAATGVGPEEQSQRTAASNGVLRYFDPTPGPITNRFYRVNKMP